MISPKYLSEAQPHLTSQMRLTLIDWLVAIHRDLRLTTSTLYLTAMIIDRFLGSSQIVGCQLQLVGLSALWLVSKYVEICIPRLTYFVAKAGSGITYEAIIEMEPVMWKWLGYRLDDVTRNAALKLPRMLMAAIIVSSASSTTQQNYPFVAPKCLSTSYSCRCRCLTFMHM